MSPRWLTKRKPLPSFTPLARPTPSARLNPTPAVSAGNVRTHDLVDVYRNSPLFRDLRDTDKLEGKCGVCEYRTVCGGSRARAYATTGNYLASDPYCAYIPARAR